MVWRHWICLIDLMDANNSNTKSLIYLRFTCLKNEQTWNHLQKIWQQTIKSSAEQQLRILLLVTSSGRISQHTSVFQETENLGNLTHKDRNLPSQQTLLTEGKLTSKQNNKKCSITNGVGSVSFMHSILFFCTYIINLTRVWHHGCDMKIITINVRKIINYYFIVLKFKQRLLRCG